MELDTAETTLSMRDGGPGAARWNAWAWAGLVATVAVSVVPWAMWGWELVDTGYLFSTRGLLHANSPWGTMHWALSWAQVLVPAVYVVAMASRSVMAVRVAAAAMAEIGLVWLWWNLHRYYWPPPWQQLWFYGLILVTAVSAAVVMRAGRVGAQPAPSGTDRSPLLGVDGGAALSLTFGLLGISLPAVLFGHLARTSPRGRSSINARVALAGLVLGYLGLAIAAGYLLATSRQVD